MSGNGAWHVWSVLQVQTCNSARSNQFERLGYAFTLVEVTGLVIPQYQYSELRIHGETIILHAVMKLPMQERLGPSGVKYNV